MSATPDPTGPASPHATVLVAAAIWVIYRLVKGWLRLNEKREVS